MSKNAIAIHAGAKLAAINPTTFEDVQRIARVAVVAGLSPRDKKDNDDTAIAKATMAIMHGLECGIPPMQAVQGIAIINGKAMMYGDLLTALLWSKGFEVDKWIDGTNDDRIGRAKIVRPGGKVIEKSFSVAQAKTARLWDTREKVKKQWNGQWEEKPNDSPWFRFADRMLEWRAFGYCVKDGASDATHGMLVREEADPDFNRLVDVTPKAESLEIPEELFADEPEQIEPTAEVSADEPIADADGLIQRIRDDLELAGGDAQVRGEIFEQYEDLIGRLPRSKRAEAESLFYLEAAE